MGSEPRPRDNLRVHFLGRALPASMFGDRLIGTPGDLKQLVISGQTN